MGIVLAVLVLPRDGSSGGGGPLNAIAQAAEKTQEEPGGRATIRAVASKPGSDTIAMRGRMVFDDEGRSRAVITVPRPNSEGSVKMTMVGEGTVMYMSSDEFGDLPDDSKWMAIDLSLGQEPEGPVPASPDAKGELEMLERVGGDVQTVGKEDIRGVPTTRYRGTLGVDQQSERLQDVGADELAEQAEKEGSPMEIEAWVDGDELVRRMRLVSSPPQVDGGVAAIDMRIDFFDFGIDPDIDIPDSSEVFDATSLAEEELRDH